MNIFYLHNDPKQCAEWHCDAHTSKMCVEYAQMLSTTHRVVDGRMWIGQNATGRKITRWFLENPDLNQVVYKVAHPNHPSTIWVRQSKENYLWLYRMWIYLCHEYTYRYGRKHESYVKLHQVLKNPPDNIKNRNFSEPPPAMKSYPECIVEGDSIQSYRNFYWADKRKFAKWTKRPEPEWWTELKKEKLH